MCILFIYVGDESSGVASEYKYIIGANRDEFIDRPALPVGIWDGCVGHEKGLTFAGKDLEAKGTWLGIRAKLVETNGTKVEAREDTPEESDVEFRIGLLTNRREPKLVRDPDALSRGHLIADFLSDENHLDGQTYTQKLTETFDRFAGYNLVVGDMKNLFYVSNRGQERHPLKLEPGFHGLSNGSLDDDWPKVVRGRENFRKVVENHVATFQTPLVKELDRGQVLEKEKSLVREIFEVMNDPTPSDKLPGIYEKDVETALSGVYVPSFPLRDRQYGTRSTAIILVKMDGTVSYTERHLNGDDQKRDFQVNHYNLKYNPTLA